MSGVKWLRENQVPSEIINKILNEIGSPVGFEFKKILYESQEMKIDVFLEN